MKYFFGWIKSVSAFLAAGIFPGMIGLMMMPILTYYISPDEYGQLSLYSFYVLLLIPVIGLSSSGLIQIEYFKLSDQERAKQISSISLIPLSGCLLFSAIVFAFEHELAALIDIQSSLILLIPVISTLLIFWEQELSILIIEKKSKFYGLLTFLKSGGEFGLTILLVIILALGWEGRIYSLLLILIVLCSFLLYRRHIASGHGIILVKNHIIAGIKYGYPLIFHAFGKLVVDQSDRIFISKMVSLSSVGIYNVGYTVASVMLLLAGALNSTFIPDLFKRLTDGSKKQKDELVRIIYLNILVLVVFFLGIIFVAPLIFRYLVDDRYLDGSNFVFWIALGYVFWGANLLFSGFLFFHKRSKTLAGIAIINVTMNIALNFFLINTFGTIGAAYATAISFFVGLLLTIFFVTRMYSLPWSAILKSSK